MLQVGVSSLFLFCNEKSLYPILLRKRTSINSVFNYQIFNIIVFENLQHSWVFDIPKKKTSLTQITCLINLSAIN